MKILLIDATFYRKEINEVLKQKKRDYFKIKRYVRDKYLGELDSSNQRNFSHGCLRMATLLKRAGAEVTFVSLEELKNQSCEINRKIDDNQFNKICFSAVTPTVPLCEKFCLRKKKKGVMSSFIIGGAHINEAKKLTQARHPNFDQYEAGYEKEAVDQILGFKASEKILEGEYVDYSILPYHIAEYALNNLFTASGCSFNCKYCADNRMPKIENSLTGGFERISPLLGEKSRLIHFFDSNMGYNQERLIEVCNALSKIKHNHIFSCNMRPELLNDEVCKALWKARFRDIMIGIENADENTLKKNAKGMKLSNVTQKLRMLQQYGFFVTAYTMVGMPFSTKETFEHTIEMCRYYIENGLVTDCKTPAIYVPYPRDDFDYLQELGVCINDKIGWENYDRQSFPVYDLKHNGITITAEEIWDADLRIHDTIIDSMCKREGQDVGNLTKTTLKHSSIMYGVVQER